MPQPSSTRVLILAVALVSVVSVTAHAQTASPPSTSSSSSTVPETSTPPVPPVVDSQTPPAPATQDDLDHLKKALLSSASGHFDPNVFKSNARFYATAHAKPVTFEDIVGSFDLMNGPTQYGAMTHQEFMAMSQPKEPGGHVGLADVGKVAAFDVAYQLAMQVISKGIEAIHKAKSEHEIQAIRAQMDKELAALAGQPIK
jgi:hypothetical protein